MPAPLQDLKSPNILVDSQWRIKIGGALRSACSLARLPAHAKHGSAGVATRGQAAAKKADFFRLCADFGLSRLLKGGRKFVTAGLESGTPEWMAPEVLRTEGGSAAADVYSYGVVLWEVLTGGRLQLCRGWLCGVVL